MLETGGSEAESLLSDVLRGAVAQASDSVMVTDPRGTILYVNAAFEQLTGYSAAEAIGATPRLLKSGRHDGEFYAKYWGHLLAGKAWRGEIINRRKDGSLYTEEHSVAPVTDAGGAVQCFICIGKDVTSREQMLRELQLLERLTLATAGAPDTEEALRSVIREVCEMTGWSLGEAWFPSSEGEPLRCGTWWSPRPGNFRLFQEATANTLLLPGEGMIGRVWATGRPEWQADVTALLPSRFPRAVAARASGIRAGFAVPIAWHDEVFAVLAFFVAEHREEDAYFVGIVSAIAAQLGSLFHRKRVQADRSRLAAIVESSVDAIISLDRTGTVTTWNRGAQVLYGYTATEMVGGKVTRIIPADRRAEQAALVARLIEGKAVPDIETVRLTRSGALVDVLLSFSPIRDRRGGTTGIASIARDITERRRAERQIREQEDALREAQRVAHVGSWHWIAATDSMYWSDEMHRIAGTDPGEPMPPNETRLNMYMPESSRRLVAAREEALIHGTPYELDLERVRADGSRRAVIVRGEPVRNAQGEIIGLRGTMQDVTERKRVEQQLLQAQKMDSIGRLAGGVAHDFNNLLTAVMGFTHLALTELPEDHPVRADLEEVAASARRGAELTRQLLAFARQQPADPTVVDLNEVLSDLHRLLARLIGEDISLTLDLDGEPACVLIDRSQIEQVIVNLAANARDAMPSGGRLTFKVERVGRLADGSPLGRDNRWIRLTVSDAGCGIDDADLAHLFEPFFTTKAPGKGTGLGLATCYGIVQQAGGEITVHSMAGNGTSFIIALPEAAAFDPGEDAGSPSAEGLAV